MKRPMRRSLRVLVAMPVAAVTYVVSYFVCNIAGMMLVYGTDLIISEDRETALSPVFMAVVFGLPLCMAFLAGRIIYTRIGRAVDED